MCSFLQLISKTHIGWYPIVGVLMAFVLMQGCSSRYATTGENLYKQSRNGPTLMVPPPLTRDNISSFYVLPNPTNGG